MKNIRLQYTSWEEMPTEVQAFFSQWMGNDAERGRAFYELYFYWWSIAHEVGHILRGYYGTHDNSHWSEEIACNQFAAAYWKARGEIERLRRLHDSTTLAISTLEDPVPASYDRAGYLDTHYSELGSNPPAYAHYQFSMVLAALDTPLDFYQALRTLITLQAHEAPPPQAAPYNVINSDLPMGIVTDMRGYLALYGVSLPEFQIVRAFSPMVQFVHWD